MISRIFRGRAIYIALLILSSLIFCAMLFLIFQLPVTALPADFQGSQIMPGSGTGSFAGIFTPSGEMPRQPEMSEIPVPGILAHILQSDGLSLGVLAFCLVVDIFCVVMLCRISRRKRRLRMEAEEADYERPVRKRGIGRSLLVLAAAVALVIALLPEGASEDEAQVQEELIEATAEKGSITRSLVYAGSIADTAARHVSYAGDIKLDSFLVNGGDYVIEGQTLAIVDRDSVILAIAELTELMDELDRDINASLDDIVENAIYAPMSGRIKSIYAKPGVRVQDTIAEHSALMRLSTDGLMAADIVAAEGMHAGMELSVTLSDGSLIPGSVESVFDGRAIVVMSDEKAGYGEKVEIYDAQGNYLCSSELYIHKEIKINGISGTVQRLNVEENMLVGTDMALVVLTDIAFRGERDLLTQQRREMEEELTKLFELYNSGEVYSPCTGRIVELNEDILVENLAFADSMLPELLSSDDPKMESYAVSVTDIQEGIITVSYIENNLQTTKQLELGTVAVFSYDKGTYKPASAEDIAVGDSLVLSCYVNGDSSLLDHVVIYPSQPEGGQGGENTGSGRPGSFGGTISIGGSASRGSGSSAQSSGQSEEKDYSLASTILCYITPFDEAHLEMTVDELDVKNYHVGQDLSVSFDALAGQSFTGTVERIDPNGENEGGSTKYGITVSVERREEMLTGMNASLRLELETISDIVTIPLAAICEEDGRCFVYTSYDEEEDALGDPVDVVCGSSDGERVEIISGLEEGDKYYYRYADTINYIFQ